MGRRPRAVGVVLAAALLAGCAQSASAPDAPAAASSAPTSSVPASADPTAAARVLSFPLNAQHGKAHGDVTVNVGPTSWEVQAKMSDLVPGATYLLNLHNGSCALEDTNFRLDMGRFDADASGHATYAQTFKGVFAVPAAGRIVTLHGPLDTEAARQHIACGDLTG